jgi:hypothetical protein
MTSLSSADNVLSSSADSKSTNTHSVQKPDLLAEKADTPNVSNDGFMNDSSPNVHTKCKHDVESAVSTDAVTPSNTGLSVSVQQQISNESSSSTLTPSSGNLIQLSPPTTPLKLPPEPIAVVDFSEQLDDQVAGQVDENGGQSEEIDKKTVSEVPQGDDHKDILPSSTNDTVDVPIEATTAETSANSSINVNVTDSADSETTSTGEANSTSGYGIFLSVLICHSLNNLITLWSL